jgi:hypothetical protein
MKKQLWGVLLLVVTLIALAGQLGSAPTGGAHTGSNGVYITKLADGSGTGNGNLWVGNGTPTVTMDGEDGYIEGTFEVDGVIRADGGIAHKITTRDVSLTSPTVTFAVQASDDVIILSSDANQTAIVPIGGTLNQRITIRAGASGSNTMRLDDGTSTVIGADFTLTEAQYDYITLDCIDADGDEWAEVSSADN